MQIFKSEREKSNNYQVYIVGSNCISIHSNLLLSISKWMSNRHFKLNRFRTELLFPLLPKSVPPANFCLDTKPSSQVWLTYTTHPSWQILLSISSKYIQNLITSHHLYQIHHLSPRLLHHYSLVSKHSQNNPLKGYVRSCLTSSKSSNGLPTPIPHSVSFMPDTLEPQGFFPLPACLDLPLVSHTFLPSSNLYWHATFSLRASPSHCI